MNVELNYETFSAEIQDSFFIVTIDFLLLLLLLSTVKI